MNRFGDEAVHYDAWYDTAMGNYVAKSETQLLRTMIRQKADVLDIGCGTGYHTLAVKDLCKTVIGVDLSPEMLQIAKMKDTSIRFLEMNALDLQFDDQSFDVVYTLAAIEFISDRERLFSEMMRVLRPGGQLLIGTIQKGGCWADLYGSDPYRENTVFQYADFLTCDDLRSLSKTYLRSEQCLFVPPNLEDHAYQNVDNAPNGKTGGFIIAEYRKEE